MSLRLTPEEWRRVNDLFHAALERDDDERTLFLTHLTDNENVLKEVKSLLRSYSQADEFLETPVAPQLLQTLGKGHDVLPPGHACGDFLILRTLGSGSFATVYLANQISLDRKVALKVSSNFGEEARNMAPLEHDNIVKVYSEILDVARDLRQICMQYVPGAPLDVVLKELTARPTAGLSGSSFLEVLDDTDTGETAFNPTALQDREKLARLDYADACLWMAWKLADALAYAHGRGVLHLDVKPGNILVSPYGRPLLTDFNVSLRKGEDAGGNLFGGTANYMAPEQAAVFESDHQKEAIAKVDHRADIFSLGVVTREMLLLGGTEISPESPKTAVDHLLKRCLAPNADDRFQNAGELADALQNALELSALEERLPAPGFITRIAARFPLGTLFFFVLGPQVLGSIVNISYNAMNVVSALTPAQQGTFKSLVLIYNLIFYPLCIAIVIRQLIPLPKCVLSPATLCEESAEALTALRRHVLRLPDWLVLVCILGWMPGSVLFPLFIHLLNGPIAMGVFGHFFLSFTLSCLVAMTYSFLYAQFVGLRVFYPRLWVRTREIQPIARKELSREGGRLRLFHLMAGIVPLAGAILVVIVGPASQDIRHYHSYRFLLFTLIAMGMLGLGFALRSAGLISQTLFALTGSDPRAKNV